MTSDEITGQLLHYFKEFTNAVAAIEDGQAIPNASATEIFSAAEEHALRAAAESFITWTRIRGLRDVVAVAESRGDT